MDEDTHNTQHVDDSRVLTHEEILELFKDLEQFEEELPQAIPEVPSTTSIQPEIEKPEIKQPEEKQEVIFQEVPAKKKLKLRRKIKEKEKHRLRFLKKTGKDQPRENKFHLLPEREPHGTFTLRLDPEGNLVGFNIKEPAPKLSVQIKQFIASKRKAKAPKEEKEPAKGIKGKLLRLIPKRGGKKEEEGEKQGRFSGIVSKIKNIIPSRKTKE